MKMPAIAKWLAIPAICLLLALVLSPAGVFAQAPPDTPLPLPEVLIYGAVAREGQPLENGTVAALLPRGGIVTAEISPVAGTGYSYVLAIPLSQYDVGDSNFAAESVRRGEMISFQIDGAPAMFLDVGGMTVSGFVIPADAIGAAYVIDLFLSGPDAYPLGDVNASGRRDSADALLVLKYDVGLIPGVTDFPPGPRTIYLPLCDIIEDGACNSSDALRILQCDVGLPGVECPTRPGAAANVEPPAAAEPVTLILHLQIEQNPSTGLVSARVLAERDLAAFGAATLDLAFDVDALAPVSCAENPDGALDLAACNSGYAPGLMRFNALATAGVISDTVLAEATFQLVDPDLDAARLLSLAAANASDLAGNPLVVEIAEPEAIPVPGDDVQLYLPLWLSFQPSAVPLVEAPGADRAEDEPPVEAPTATPIPEEIPTPETAQKLYLPLLYHAQTVGASGRMAPLEEDKLPDLDRRLYLPQFIR